MDTNATFCSHSDSMKRKLFSNFITLCVKLKLVPVEK